VFQHSAVLIRQQPKLDPNSGRCIVNEVCLKHIRPPSIGQCRTSYCGKAIRPPSIGQCRTSYCGKAIRPPHFRVAAASHGPGAWSLVQRTFQDNALTTVTPHRSPSHQAGNTHPQHRRLQARPAGSGHRIGHMNMIRKAGWIATAQAPI